MTVAIPKLNYISLIEDVLPVGIFDSSLTVYDAEYYSKIKSRAMSTFTEDNLIENGQWRDGATDFYILVIESRFKDKWKRLNDLWNREYDPLKPFDITLSESYNETFEVLKDSSTTDNKDEMYGFNSIEPTPTDTGKSTRTNEYKRENPHTRDYTRKGNIGNTSMQDLIKQEREVLRYQIIDVIYNDITSVLCRGKYT